MSANCVHEVAEASAPHIKYWPRFNYTDWKDCDINWGGKVNSVSFAFYDSVCIGSVFISLIENRSIKVFAFDRCKICFSGIGKA